MSFVGPVDLLLPLAKQSVSVVIDAFINRVYPTYLLCTLLCKDDTILTQCERSSTIKNPTGVQAGSEELKRRTSGQAPVSQFVTQKLFCPRSFLRSKPVGRAVAELQGQNNLSRKPGYWGAS